MKPVRVRDALYTIGALRCLVCGQLAHHTPDAVGILTVVCEGKRCRKRRLAVRLPPGTTGAVLVELYGAEVADALHRALCPESDACSVDALEAWVLPISASCAVYLQRMPDTPEPTIGWARAQAMIHSLMRSA